MTSPRDRRWLGIHGLMGGSVMFVIEGVTVVGLVVAALLISSLLMAIF